MMLDARGLAKVSGLFSLLGIASRLHVLQAVADRERSLADLETELGMPRSTLTENLRYLRLEGLIESKRRGHEVRWYLTEAGAEAALVIARVAAIHFD